jgi:polyvinyl alcohol dehydrogenase (cytochrome)
VYAQDGAALFKSYCASCHEDGTNGDSRVPGRDVLGKLTPEQILQTLEKGAMKAQAAERSRAQRSSASAAGTSRDLLTGVAWNGWGVTITNSRFESADVAGMTADDIPRLKLKWAFGFPGATSGGTQPVVVGGRLYVADAEGDLFALDALTGCIHWTVEVEAGVRSAVTIGARGSGGLAVYFGDQSANMYALDAESGKVLW